MSTASIDLYSVASKNPLLAILRNIPLEDTLSFAQAVVDGGVRFFEVALNSPHGLEQIERLRNHFGGSCYIGAGTAITVEHCRRALAAGAQFLLTPGTPPDVFEYCASHALALLPGVLTPGDVSIALEYGYNTLKLFPAGSMPLRYVKDLKGPFDNTHYIAIGGVTGENLTDFLSAGYLGVGMAGSLMPSHILRTKNWEEGSRCVKAMTDRIRALQKTL